MTSKFLAVLCLCTPAAVAVAEGLPPPTADIPFEFSVGKTVVTAGHYEILQDSSRGTMAVRSFANGGAAVELAQPARSHSAGTESQLIFNKYGDRYFLAEIWRGGSSQGVQLIRSKRERGLARASGAHELAAVLAVRQAFTPAKAGATCAAPGARWSGWSQSRAAP